MDTDRTSRIHRLNAFIIATGLLALPVFTAIRLTENPWQLDGSYWVMAWFDDPAGAFRIFAPLAILAIVDLNAVLLGIRLIVRLVRLAPAPVLTRSDLILTGATLLLGALTLWWLYSLSLSMLALPALAMGSVGVAWRYTEPLA